MYCEGRRERLGKSPSSATSIIIIIIIYIWAVGRLYNYYKIKISSVFLYLLII